MAYGVKSKKKTYEKVPMWKIEKKNMDAGQYWFSQDTKRFFKSKVPDEAIKKGNSAYFISSETDPNGKTAFTIREADLKTGSINTVGDFHSFNTRDEAKKELNKVLAR